MQKQPKILVITCDLNLGGTERHLSTILPYIWRQNFNVIVATLGNNNILAEVLQKNDVQVVCLINAKMSTFINILPKCLIRVTSHIIRLISCARLINTFEPDIIHFFLPGAYVVGGLAAFMVGFSGKQIMSRRSLNHYQKNHFLIKTFEQFLHKRMSCIVGNSLAVINDLRHEMVRADRLKLIYNGIDMATISAMQTPTETLSALNLEHNSFIMLQVANLIPYKGHKDLLNALAKIASLLPQPWYLLCIGRDAGIGTELKAQAEKLNLTTNIVWLDMQKNIGNFLAITHLQIVASHEEGFSNVILEGMMSGLPMVVTDVGGNSEAIEHEQQGLVVPAHDIVALSEAILALASQPQKLISYKENTLNKAKQFSLTACIDNYINLYNSVLLEKEQ